MVKNRLLIFVAAACAVFLTARPLIPQQTGSGQGGASTVGSLAGEAPGTSPLLVGDRAVVSGNFVRVRSGPTLEHRIITKVSSGTELTVLGRGEKPQEIGGTKSYWYQVRLDTESGGLEGWVFGQFLKKKAGIKERAGEGAAQGPGSRIGNGAAEPLEPVAAFTAEVQARLAEIGTIDGVPLWVTTGDLDRSGKTELLFLTGGSPGRRPPGGRSFTLQGFEQESAGSGSGLKRVYSIDMRGVQVDRVDLLATRSLDFPILAAASAQFTNLYTYDAEKGLLRLVFKLNSPIVSLGTLDGTNPFLVSLRRSKTAGNDGTITYIIEANRIEPGRGRFQMKEKTSYGRPLPVKKLVLFDLDGDGKDEIIAEIGGRESGGGIVALKQSEGGFTRLFSTGIPTYNDSQFVSLWGASIGGKPRLVVYSTDPADPAGAGTSFGFITASFVEGSLRIETFQPVNKMLDEANNDRRVVLLPAVEGVTDGMPSFLIVDAEPDANRSSIKKVLR